jgi:hypothetical protein
MNQEEYTTWLSSAMSLEASGDVDAALDVIFNSVDSLFFSENFQKVEQVIEALDPDILSTELLLGIMIATLAATSRLAGRRKFVACAAESISARGEMEEGLLDGLE